MSVDRVVVVGGGLAGLRAIESLRSRRYGGEVTLVGAERHAPYDRPPLSKHLLAGGVDDTTLDADFATLGVRLRLGETAVRVADDDDTVLTDRGAHRFDRLVLATGSVPIGLPGGGPQRFLRTIDDARSLRSLMRPGLRLVIVGAGWIGAELATAAVARGCLVTVLEAGEAPLAAAMGAKVGSQTSRWYAECGVDLRLGAAVAEVTDTGLTLSDGERIAADEVVTAASRPGVFAVGDCAAFWSRRYRRRLRVEHWDNALHAPDVAGANVLGGVEVYNPVPYFWSEQFGRMMQYIGHHNAADSLLWRGDPAQEQWSACWLADGRLVALLAVGRRRDLSQGRGVIASGAFIDPVRLADPDIPVREVVRG